jgi:hypothetical protein
VFGGHIFRFDFAAFPGGFGLPRGHIDVVFVHLMGGGRRVLHVYQSGADA